MPQEITKHKTILDAIERLDLLKELTEKHDGHFKFELDLEVIAYGRNYNGKKVGPALRLLRKLNTFGRKLDVAYRRHGLGRTLEDVRQAAQGVFGPDLLTQLGD